MTARTEARAIGRYDQGHPGPLIVAIGAMHGNEPAGVLALERLFDALAREERNVPDFTFRGRLLGVVGNITALAWHRRFVDRDLNRALEPDYFCPPPGAPDPTEVEAYEAAELTALIEAEVAAYAPAKVVVLDLHTTTADGGAFTIVRDDPASLRLAEALHAPVILGMADDLHDTTLHYFTDARLGVPTAALVFESGQHGDPAAVDMAYAALVCVLGMLEAVDARHVDPRHEAALRAYGSGLPDVVRLVYGHRITPSDGFVMRPGYRNFDIVAAGEPLAEDRRGVIVCPQDGRILMPLYQQLGEDGFFVVEEVGPASAA